MADKFNNYIPEDSSFEVSPYPQLARIVSHLDPRFMGGLQVELLREVGNELIVGQTIFVKTLTPFWGQTPNTDNQGYPDTQKSYGMWMVPPDVGTVGLVIFINGNIKSGFWLGVVPDTFMNFMTPGLAATSYNESNSAFRVPVAEYNKKIFKSTGAANVNAIPKPVHPITNALIDQGLLLDDIRGITSSSARRDIPSMVFGFSTPGPLDRDGPTIKVGTLDDQVNQFMSRLGGTTLVMDDGDSAFLRKGSASDTAPDYASIEEDETPPSNPNIPHNELFRIRTRTGHQILLHNSEDLIYIGNAKGTAWVELTSNGKIDIYSKDSISVHTDADLNFRAERDINLEAGRNLNINVANNKTEMILKDANTIVYQNNKITTVGNLNVATVGTNLLTSNGRTDVSAGAFVVTAGRVFMNSKTKAEAAVAATPLTLHQLPGETGEAAFNSIMKRVPTHEPWPHHENLNPTAFTLEKTDRNSTESIAIPDAWQKYTTNIDTFRRDPP